MPAAPRILLVEDDQGLQLTLGDRLASEGYSVAIEGRGEAGLDRARTEPFDLVLLDVMLPRLSGFDVCVALRESGVDVPIIMLTARGQLQDRVAGLKLGADDYLVKPFAMAELLARIEARVRRAPSRASSRVHRFGDVTVDLGGPRIERAGQAVELAAKELQLLCYFVEHRGKTLSRDELLEQVWGYKAATASRTLDVHVAGLRRKLEPQPHQPRHLVTVHGQGYKLIG
jgi:two-component system, OmpR family, alkaline phosphatase synthesis response regulator PhoP